MRLGIVGSEGAKFTPETREIALEKIAELLGYGDRIDIEGVSGGCHLGGIDVWTREICKELGIPFTECPPASRTWRSFKRRNIEIAEISDRVVCITVQALPPGFREGGWERYCYHCKTDQHIKSGGCWTVKYAREKLGKPGEIIVI